MKKNSIAVLVCILFFLMPVLGTAQSNVGEVQIYVFSKNGLPMEGVEVKAEGEIYTSDENGLINFVHSPGTHEFTLTHEGSPVARVQIPIRQAQVVEITVTADPEAAKKAVGETSEETREEIEKEERQALSGEQPTGSIQGQVIDFESEEPIVDATVIFRGVDYETTTDDGGRFTANVPAGEYSFSVIHPDYATQTIDQVKVAVDEKTSVDVELTPSGVQLKEVQVFASEEVIVQGGIANLIEETRNSSAVMNLIGAEQIGRTGDSDAAGALKRVTGLTVVDGKYVYVRGMGERYSSSLLNGARLPSPEPDRRVVPLDLFPTSVVESIAVQKSYAPNLSGDFGGGAISIRSAGIPDDRYQRRLRTDIGVSFGYNQGTTFTNRLAEVPGDLDWLGIDDGSRKLPDEFDKYDYVSADTTPLGEPIYGLTEEELTELGKKIPNTFAPEERKIPLNYGVNASVRDKVELGDDKSFGFNIAALYSNSWNYNEGELSNYVKDDTSSSGYSPQNEFITADTEHDIDVGTLLDFVYRKRNAFDVEATTLLVRTTDSTTSIVEGFYGLDGDDIKRTEIAWTENMLLSQSLGGSFGLNVLNQSIFNYQYVFSLANRYQPDNRFTFYEESGGTLDGEFDDENADASTRRDNDQQRVWTNVQDIVHDATTYVEIPFFLTDSGGPDYLDIGVYGMYQDRTTDLRRFAYEVNGNIVSLPPEELFDDENLGYGQNQIEFKEVTEKQDNYTAQHMIGAGYAEADMLLPNSWRLSFGARAEYSSQQMNTFNNDGTPVEGMLNTFDVLPSFNLTIPTGKKKQLRLSGSRTVNRPGLRELSIAPFYGPPGFGVERGNPDLQEAVLYNGDIRWESYISMNESLAFGGFYKYFDSPIETVTVYGANKERIPINIASAQNFGVELEWALQLRYISDLLRRSMMGLRFDSIERERRWRRTIGSVAGFFRDLRTTGNVAYIHSNIDFGGTQQVKVGESNVAISNTEDERPLEGQAPYVVNAALGYRNEVSWSLDTPLHTSVFLNYNVVGPHITRVGVQGVPDRYLQPFHQMDLVVRQQLGYIWSIGFEVGNILDPVARETLGESNDDEVVKEYRKGRSFSLSVKASF